MLLLTELILTGLRRRKKELVLVILVALIVAFFMSGLLMVRSILEAYFLERNRSIYGDWVIASTEKDLSHPYLKERGYITSLEGSCTDDGGTPLGPTIGTLSREIMDFGRISFYEGHYPEKEDEIAADLLSLEKLGYSYELGQTITVSRMVPDSTGASKLVQKAYTLVGTVKPFATLWNAGQGILYPNLLVTGDALAGWNEEQKDAWFYRMDPAVEKADPQEFFKGFADVHEGAPLLFNEHLYNVALFGESGNGLVTGLVIAFAVFAISFALASYTDKQRQAYYRLRMLGSSRRRLNGIIAAECGLASLVPAAIGLGLTYLFGYIVCSIIAGNVGLQGFFAFEPPVFLNQILAILGTFMIAVLLAMFHMRDRRLRPASMALTPKSLEKLRTAIKRLKKHAEDPFLRRRIVNRTARFAGTLFTFVVISFLLLCGTEIYSSAVAYRFLEEQPDYVISIKAPELLKVPHGDYVAEDGERIVPEDSEGLRTAVLNPYFGPDEQELAYLDRLPGIRSFRGRVDDNWHFISWDGIGMRPDLRNASILINGKKYTEEPEMTTASINILKDDRLLVRIGEENNRILTAEERAQVMRGEYAVILYNDRWLNAETGKNEQIPEALLTPREGEKVRIFSETAPTGLEIPVFRIIREPDAAPKIFSDYLGIFGITLFISEPTAEQLRQQEPPGTEFRENYFQFTFDAGASFEATDKALASFTMRHANSDYINNAEAKRSSFRTAVLRPFMTYGSLFLMTLFVYLILMYNMTELRIRGNSEMCRGFRLLGMTKKKLSIKLLLAEAREALTVLYGFVVGSTFLGVWRFIHVLKELRDNPSMQYVLEISGKFTRDPIKITGNWFVFSAGVPVLLIFVLILFIGLTAFNWQVSRRILKTEGIL